MTTRGLMAGAALAACALATTADAQLARGDTGTIATFAREWSTGLGTPRCEDGSLLAGRPAQCTWGPAQSLVAPWLQYTPAEARGAPAMVMWHRLASDPAHARRMMDSLDAALVARGAERRECGSGPSPAGVATGFVWESPTLAAHAVRFDEPAGTARMFVVASDQAGVMSLDVLCPRRAADAPMRDTTRVVVADPAALVFHPESIVLVAFVEQPADSALTIVHHRTGRPIADSAAVRRAYVERLARPHALDGEPWVQAERARWLVVRPCWTDVCPRDETEGMLRIRPDDVVLVRQADGSWKPQR